jgi:di- and tripeptidase
VIPATIRAQISVRIVPDQKLEEIISLFVQHVEDSFLDLQSPHRLKVLISRYPLITTILTRSQVTVDRTADWWLGDVESQWFKALESSIEHVWNVEPLRIREGGVRVGMFAQRLLIPDQSIPSIPWLEKEFQSPVLHLPMGQNSVRVIELGSADSDAWVSRIMHIYRMSGSPSTIFLKEKRLLDTFSARC